MLACAEAIRRGELTDTLAPSGEHRPLFVRGQIPNHGVLGRAGAAGYLRRVTKELGERGLKTEDAAAAAERMQASSDLFRVIRYEPDLQKAADVLARIAEQEIAALRAMERAWEDVKIITTASPRFAVAAE